MKVGVIQSLWRYPVKSMLGEQLRSFDVDARGVIGDRLFAVRDVTGKFGSGKNSRRFRRIPGMFGFTARYDGEVPLVTFPDGRLFRGDDPEVHPALSTALGLPLTLAKEEAIPHHDNGPIHLVTTSALGELAGNVDARRFRPNLVIDTPGFGFPEDDWVEVAIGEHVRLRVRSRTERCVMIGFAQAELKEAPGLLENVVIKNDACFGVYAEVLTPGAISVGDSVRLL